MRGHRMLGAGGQAGLKVFTASVPLFSLEAYCAVKPAAACQPRGDGDGNSSLGNTLSDQP